MVCESSNQLKYPFPAIGFDVGMPCVQCEFQAGKKLGREMNLQENKETSAPPSSGVDPKRFSECGT